MVWVSKSYLPLGSFDRRAGWRKRGRGNLFE